MAPKAGSSIVPSPGTAISTAAVTISRPTPTSTTIVLSHSKHDGVCMCMRADSVPACASHTSTISVALFSAVKVLYVATPYNTAHSPRTGTTAKHVRLPFGTFHMECFVCSHEGGCANPLIVDGASAAFMHDQRPYCGAHYKAVLAEKKARRKSPTETPSPAVSPPIQEVSCGLCLVRRIACAAPAHKRALTRAFMHVRSHSIARSITDTYIIPLTHSLAHLLTHTLTHPLIHEETRACRLRWLRLIHTRCVVCRPCHGKKTGRR